MDPPRKEAPVFLDVGANVGVVSILMAKMWPDARIVAVEPALATFRYLLWNLRENGVTKQVWPLNVALSNSSGRNLPMLYSANHPTGTLVGATMDSDQDDFYHGVSNYFKLGEVRHEKEQPGLEHDVSHLQ